MQCVTTLKALVRSVMSANHNISLVTSLAACGGMPLVAKLVRSNRVAISPADTSKNLKNFSNPVGSVSM